MRDPSINLRRSHLVFLLGDRVDNPEELADYLLREGRSVACTNRSLVVPKTTAKKSRKVNLAVPVEDVELFNKILTSTRIARQHRFIPLRKEDSLWATLAKVTDNANAFAETLGYDSKLSAYKDYVRIGLDMMRSYSLQRLLSFRDSIVEMQVKLQELGSDDNPEATEVFTMTYQQIIREECGSYVPVNLTEHKLGIYRGRLLADSLNADYGTYVRAQVAKLEWTGNPPEPSQLYGDNARERYLSYKGVVKDDYFERVRQRNEKSKQKEG